MVVADPEALISGLREHGVDASRATSSIAVVEAPAGRSSPAEASQMMSGVVFLQVYPEIHPRAFDAMVDLVNDRAALREREEWAVTTDGIIYRRTTLGLRGFDAPEIRHKISAVLESGATVTARYLRSEELRKA